jgi:hypothetical protein
MSDSTPRKSERKRRKPHSTRRTSAEVRSPSDQEGTQIIRQNDQTPSRHDTPSRSKPPTSKLLSAGKRRKPHSTRRTSAEVRFPSDQEGSQIIRKNDQTPSRHDTPSSSKPPTSKLLSAAKRARDYKQDGRGLTRQLDIPLRATPLPGVPFRIWPNPDDEHPVAILKVSNDYGRKDVYILSEKVADLPYVAPKVRNGRLGRASK